VVVLVEVDIPIVFEPKPKKEVETKTKLKWFPCSKVGSNIWKPIIVFEPNPNKRRRPKWEIPFAQKLGQRLVIPIVEFETKPKRNTETKLNYSCSNIWVEHLVSMNTTQWLLPISWQQRQCSYSDWIWGPQLQSFNNHSETPIGKKKKEKGRQPSLHDTTPHWLHGNSIPSFGCHYFWPGLLALPKNTLPIVLLPFISCMAKKYTYNVDLEFYFP